MPLGAPIGTNRGLRTEEMIRILIEEMDLPIIVARAQAPEAPEAQEKIEKSAGEQEGLRQVGQ